MKRRVGPISGVYQIINLKNGVSYVGSSFNIGRRAAYHRWELRNNRHGNINLQHDWNKYGEDNFEIEILFECIPEDRLIHEQHFLDTVSPLYNILVSAHPGRTDIPHSEETKKKMRKTAIKNNNFRHIEKYIEESKRPLIDTNGFMYDSLTMCSNSLGISPSTICDVLMGRSKRVKKLNLSLAYLDNIPSDFFDIKEYVVKSRTYEYIDVFEEGILLGRFPTISQIRRKFGLSENLKCVMRGYRRNSTKYKFEAKKKGKSCIIFI